MFKAAHSKETSCIARCTYKTGLTSLTQQELSGTLEFLILFHSISFQCFHDEIVGDPDPQSENYCIDVFSYIPKVESKRPHSLTLFIWML